MKCISHPLSTGVFITLLACSNFVRAEATEIVPDVFYQGGTALISSDMGMEFTVPQGWQAILPQGADVMIMKPDNAVARMIISAIPNRNEASLMQLMNQNHPLDRVSQLVPTGKAGKQGKLYYQRYTMQGNNPQNLVAEAYAALGENQSAFIAVSLAPEDKSQFSTLAKNLVSSVSFKTPEQTEAQHQCSGNIDWEQQLRGRTLHYRHSTNGKSINRKLNLCSNHSFSYKDRDSFVSSDNNLDFSATTQSGKKGRWHIEDNQLMLRWLDGSRSSYTLSRRYIDKQDEWGTFLDDEHWLNRPNRTCY